MNASIPDSLIEPRWLTYTKTAIFTAPAVMAWGFACIFLVPKVNEISHMAGSNLSALSWLWPATFFLVHWGREILVAGILTILLLELVLPVADLFLIVLSAKLASHGFWRADRTAMVNLDRITTL